MPAPAPGSSDALPPPPEPARFCAGVWRAAGGSFARWTYGFVGLLSFFLPSVPLPGSLLPASATRRYSPAPSAKPLFIRSLLRARAAALGASPATAVLGGWPEVPVSPPLGSCLRAKPGSLLRPAGARPTEPAGAPGGALPGAPSAHLAPEGFRCCWRASERVSSPVRLLALRGSAP